VTVLTSSGLRPNGPPFFSPGHRPGSQGIRGYHAAWRAAL